MSITRQEYDAAVAENECSTIIINQFHKEEQNRFDERLKSNPIFTDEELRYSAVNICPCGHGLAYPKNCGGGHYWDCSAILKGVADTEVEHTGKLHFAFYSIKGESSNLTTRGVLKPKQNGNVQ